MNLGFTHNVMRKDTEMNVGFTQSVGENGIRYIISKSFTAQSFFIYSLSISFSVIMRERKPHRYSYL